MHIGISTYVLLIYVGAIIAAILPSSESADWTYFLVSASSYADVRIGFTQPFGAKTVDLLC